MRSQDPRAVRRTVALLCSALAAAPLVRSQTPVSEARPRAEVRTSLGTMVVELYNETPVHRDNFLKLAREGFYDSLPFHRVIPGFVVQGGDPDGRHAPRERALGSGGPGYTLPAEIVPGLVHHKGALAAARQGDDVNPGRRSSGSQFYIVQGRTYQPAELNMMTERLARMGRAVEYTEADRATYAKLGGAPHLDGGYTIFGRVVQGLEVLDAIAAQPCDGRDRPLNDVRMFIRPLP